MFKDHSIVHQIKNYRFPTLLLAISLPLLSAYGHSGGNSSTNEPLIVAAVSANGSAEKDFVLNNGGKGAEVAIDFSGDALDSQANESIGSSFKIVSTSPVVCTVDNNGDDGGYVVTFVSDSDDCKISLYSVVKSTTDSSGTIQFSEIGKETARYAYTNQGYLMAISEEGDSSTYHDSAWSKLVPTGMSLVLHPVSAHNTTLNGTVYIGGAAASAAVNSYSATNNSWGEPQTPSVGGIIIHALTVSEDGVVYAASEHRSEINDNDFAIRATNGVWKMSPSPFSGDIAAFTVAPNGTLYTGSPAASDNFATYINNGWSWLSTDNSQGNSFFLLGSDGTLYALSANNSKTDQLAIRANDGTWTLVDGILDDYSSAMGITSDGTLYVGSGAGSGNTNFASYDVNGNWTDLSTNNPVNEIDTIAVATDDTIYIGGMNNNEPTIFAAAYDPSNDSWQTMAQPALEKSDVSINQLSFYNVLSLQAE